MNKRLLILSILFIAGCSTSSSMLPSRYQINTGMTPLDTWKLYGYDPNNHSFTDLPVFLRQSVIERQIDDCTYNTYRYWLEENSKEIPFLLIFESCKLSNYDAVQKEKKQKFIELKHLIKNNADIQKEYEALTKPMQLSPEDEEILMSLLFLDAKDPNNPFIKRCTTDMILVQIQRDENYTGTRRAKKSVLSTIFQSNGLKKDAYGPGIHMNQYGQPVTLRPDWGGIPGERLKIKQNAYGPGIHMDQYGRPVREYSWP